MTETCRYEIVKFFTSKGTPIDLPRVVKYVPSCTAYSGGVPHIVRSARFVREGEFCPYCGKPKVFDAGTEPEESFEPFE